METQNQDYNISFFKPTTEVARVNRNLTMKLLLIWVIAIFGFHILLRVIEKPTPEIAYTSFKSVWENVKTGNATLDENRVFIKSALSVLGKLLIQPDDRVVLDKAVSSVLYNITPETKRVNLSSNVDEFNNIKDKIETLQDKKYVALKSDIIKDVSEIIDVEPYSLEANLVPFELTSENMKNQDIANIDLVEGVMAKYLIHNQSFLTDTKFLGYPFHYFYTAVFLLILFVALCWVYCYKIDKLDIKLGIVEVVE